MRLASFENAGRASYGLVAGDKIVDLGARFGARAPTLREMLKADLLKEASAFVNDAGDFELSDVKLLPTIPDPAHVWCLAINYMDHVHEVNAIGIKRDPPKKPAVFMRYADSLVGGGEPMLMPTVSDEFDYECELAVIIGRGGRNISEADALSHVAGYSIFNDGSIRDWQFHAEQIAVGKNFANTGSIGPWLVTADEVPDPHNLNISTRLNGNVMQSGNTRDMLFKIPAFIAYVSAVLPLQPGDILATGTPAGVGFSRRPQVFMKPGDVCEVEIETIGKLTNPIGAA
jgi:2-keto-4-pentenoate hydratase/2-oxohepta-3-ene-1,7-dioic acid hydratase in catechol pathway